MNDLMRDTLCEKDGSIKLWAEMVAGGTVSIVVGPFTLYCKIANFLVMARKAQLEEETLEKHA